MHGDLVADSVGGDAGLDDLLQTGDIDAAYVGGAATENKGLQTQQQRHGQSVQEGFHKNLSCVMNMIYSCMKSGLVK
jgi:hypothetical protein